MSRQRATRESAECWRRNNRGLGDRFGDRNRSSGQGLFDSRGDVRARPHLMYGRWCRQICRYRSMGIDDLLVRREPRIRYHVLHHRARTCRLPTWHTRSGSDGHKSRVADHGTDGHFTNACGNAHHQIVVGGLRVLDHHRVVSSNDGIDRVASRYEQSQQSNDTENSRRAHDCTSDAAPPPTAGPAIIDGSGGIISALLDKTGQPEGFFRGTLCAAV